MTSKGRFIHPSDWPLHQYAGRQLTEERQAKHRDARFLLGAVGLDGRLGFWLCETPTYTAFDRIQAQEHTS